MCRTHFKARGALEVPPEGQFTKRFHSAVMDLCQNVRQTRDDLDVHTAQGAAIADALAVCCMVLPNGSAVRDEFVDVGYSAASLGVDIFATSRRTAARFNWYFGLDGGFRFVMAPPHPELIIRCPDDFWYALAALGQCGSLIYEAHQSLTDILPKEVERHFRSSRSATFRFASDIVLAAF